MKFLAILTLFLFSQTWCNVSATSSPLNDIKFSRRLLVLPKDESAGIIDIKVHPVRLARKLILDLKLYHLVNEVVQAKYITDGNIRLLFEMGSALQANAVFQKWQESQGELSSQMNVAPSDCSFYEAVCTNSQTREI
ncbi:uncharacterized protein LOC111599178 [Drosophila hydei]|uniref:Uncharacterized protein LOC111599178 n=1 Tax=Drosophila hydei TaxID=7224 RepID=A0A6J1LXT9_DROHY|nr:uncharacterized protein LOC111599178 [Drosophila hydei]